MANTDIQLEQIIFNTLSQEKYDELKANGQINPNEIYLVPDTDDETSGLPTIDESTSGMILSNDGTNAEWIVDTDITSNSWDLFDCKFSDHILDNPSWVKSDDNNWIDGNVYKSAYEWLENEWTKEFDGNLGLVTEGLYKWVQESSGSVVYTYDEFAQNGIRIYTYDENTKTLELWSTHYEELKYGGYVKQGQVQLEYYKTKPEWVTDDWNITYRNVGIKLCAPSECDRIDYRYGPSAQGDGIAWYYVIDTENKRFKLPRTKYNFVGTRGNVGEVVLGGTDGFSVSATEMYLYFFLGETIKDGRIIDINNIIDTTTQLQNNVYTKEEVDAKLDNVTVDLSGYATITNVEALVSPKADTMYVNDELDKKADKETTYTKTEVDNLLSPKATTEYVDGQIDLVEKSITDNVNTINQALVLKADKTEIPTKTSQLTNDSGYLTQHQDISGKADKSDTYTKSEVDAKVSSVYRFKGSIAKYDALPTSGLVVGDVYNTEDTGANYAWNGTTWDKLSETIDLTPYLTKEEATTTYATIGAVNSEIEALEGSIGNKADKETTYTKTEVDELLGNVSVDETNLVHKSGNETISGVKTFEVSPLVPTIGNTTDSSQSAASTKFVQDVVNTVKTTITYWD